jgi:hypothetical protein
MTPSRLSAGLLASAALITLAACGGGGGGGTTPPTTPGGPPPATSTPAPGSSATPSPSPSPTATPTSAPVGTSSVLVSAEENYQNGDSSWYTSGTASWSNHAGGTSSAPNGSAPVDGMSCAQVTEGTSYPQTQFSQHAFVGIMNNGTWEALPQAIGMVNPQPPTTPYPGNPNGHPSDTYAVEVSQCEYNMHTHDYSGLVHIEDETLAQTNTSMPSYATLQALFDLWGAQLGASGITAGTSTLTGPVSIYVGTPSGRNSQNNDEVNSYTLYTGAAKDLQFSKHMAVWIVVGTPPAAGLPAVQFVVSN